MPCYRVANGVACTIGREKRYRYQGWYFSFNDRFGPHPLRHDGELSERSQNDTRFWNGFWRMYEAFAKEQAQERFEVKE